MNKAELIIKIAIAKQNFAHNNGVLLPKIKSAIEADKTDINNFELQLAELNKPKTGRVKIGDDLSGVDEIFITNSCGSVVASYTSLGSVFLNNYIKQGRVFYDRATTELFALREVTEYKIWCKFGDDVRIVAFDWIKNTY